MAGGDGRIARHGVGLRAKLVKVKPMPARFHQRSELSTVASRGNFLSVLFLQNCSPFLH